MTALVFTGDVEACLQRLQRIPGLSPWRPLRFSVMCFMAVVLSPAYNFDGLAPDCGNSGALAVEIPQSCTKRTIMHVNEEQILLINISCIIVFIWFADRQTDQKILCHQIILFSYMSIMCVERYIWGRNTGKYWLKFVLLASRDKTVITGPTTTIFDFSWMSGGS